MWTVYGIQTESYISLDQDEEAVVFDVGCVVSSDIASHPIKTESSVTPL